jgi:hypothetical protein
VIAFALKRRYGGTKYLLSLVRLLLVFLAVAHGVVYVGIKDLTVAGIVAQVDLVGVHF